MKKLFLIPFLLLMLSCNRYNEEEAVNEKELQVVNSTPVDSSSSATKIKGSWLGETIIKDGYFFIPETALQDSVKAIVYPLYHPDEKFGNKKVFNLYWHPGASEGSYNITITPEQIYLASDLGDKNPSYLYWVQNITSVQYEQVATSLKNKTPEGFVDVSQNYPERCAFFDENSFGRLSPYREPTTAEWNEVFNNRDSLQRAQIEKVYGILNTMIARNKNKLIVPTKTEMEQFRPILFGFSRVELQDWVEFLKN